MAKKQSSELKALLILLRRIIVLSFAAFGLWREMPYETLLVRAAILWAILYLSSETVEVVFRYLSNQARKVVIHEEDQNPENKQVAVQKAS
jgi:hypothetical protein